MNKLLLPALAALLLPLSSFADPVVTDVVAKQRYPWNGLVDISFTLSESSCIAIVATNTATGAEVPVRSLRDKASNAVGKGTEFAPGKVSLIWDASADVPETLIEALALSVVGAPPHGKVQLWAGGPYWAETNIGAEKPEDSGLYFWWGDTMGYRREGSAWVASDGSSSNFSFSEGNAPTYGKDSSTLQSEGWITSAGVLAPEHDAAHVHWGGSWRMPTKDELSALTSNCDWTWTTRNGVNGYVVRGRGAYSSASIFLPAAGSGYGTSLYDAGSYGTYRSSVPSESNSSYAWYLCFYSGSHYTSGNGRNYGQSVRPVQGFSETATTVGGAGNSASFSLDTTDGLLVADTIVITYDTSWIGGDPSAAAVISDNGIGVRRVTGAGEFTHTLSGTGRHELVFTTLLGGVAQEEVYRATVYKGKYTIHFDANGGEGAMADCEVGVNMPFDIPQCTFTKDGHFLLGWALTPDGEATLLDGDLVCNIVAKAGDTVTLYAVWHEGNGIGGKLLHRWSFNGDLTDSASGQDAVAVGNVTNDGHSYRLAGGSWGNSYINLGSDVLPKDGSAATIEIWATKHSFQRWGRIFDFGTGSGDSDYVCMAWSGQYESDCPFRIYGIGGNVSGLEPYDSNREYHFAMVFKPDANGTWNITAYKQDAGTGETLKSVALSSGNSGWSLANQGMQTCWLGHSRYSGDLDANASYNEVRVWRTALTESELASNAQNGPDDNIYNAYTVRFEANGGVGTMTNRVYSGGDTVTLPTLAFVRNGWTFMGWATEADGPVAYADEATIDGGLDAANGVTMTLYARWGKDSYSIHFDANGGQGTMANQTMWLGFPESLATNSFARERYIFAGWAMAADGAVAHADGAVVSNLTAAADGEVTLYAVWADSRIVFDVNGGEGEMEPFLLFAGTDQTLPAGTFTKDGHFLLGWAFTPDGEATLLDGDSIADIVAEAGETVTLYAVWHEGEGGGNGLSIQYYDISSSDYSTWSSSETALTNYFSSRIPTIVTNTIAFGYSLDPGIAGVESSSVNQFRSWGLNDLRFEAGGTTNRFHGKYAQMSQEYISAFLTGYIEVPENGTYSFACIADDYEAIFIDGVRVCRSQWNTVGSGSVKLEKGVHSFSMGFHEGDGGHGFAVQWKKPGDTSWSPLPQSVLTDGKFTTYAIRFDANDGEGTMPKRVFASGDDAELPVATFTRDGWSFLGWGTEADGPVEYADGATIDGGLDAANGETTTLYARWGKDTYTVHFDANGGDGAMADESFWLGIPDTLTPNAFTRTGYTFAGWAAVSEGEILFGDGALVTNLTETANASVTLYATWDALPPQYLVIDLESGSGAASYPVTYLAEPPEGGFNEDEYKTTKLALRRIDPGTFMMGGQYETTLTRPYYIGVFEVTQRQYELVTGSNPSQYTGDMRPIVESYNTIRGSSLGAQWPSSSGVDANSFMGKLQSRTGIGFDLPTEAQWEYACRAGTTSAYNNGGSTEEDLKLLGRYQGDKTDGKGGYTDAHTTVGSYLPNAWSLYDMHGNVWEWCLDWYGNLASPLIDPAGATAGSYRVLRGGSWRSTINDCPSSNRDKNSPSSAGDHYGFRLSLLPCSYAIRFDGNGSEGMMTRLSGLIVGADVALPANAFTRYGWIFLGWATAADGPVKYADGETAEGGFDAANGETLALYARWTQEPYTVHFDANGGGGTMVDEQFGIDIPGRLTPNAFTRTGYTFAGWATAADGDVAHGDGALVTNLTETADATVNLYAVWSPNHYQVRFNSGSGTGSMPNQTISYDAATALSVNTFAKTGYHFAGWATEADGEVVYGNCGEALNLASGDGDVVDLYATWVPNGYTVAFDSNGGAGTMQSQQFTYDEGQALTVNTFTRASRFFAGWATAANGAVANVDCAVVSNLTTAANDEVRLYAVWADSRVVFDANSGEGSMGTFFVFSGTEQTLPQGTFTKDGHFLLGWALTPDGEATLLDGDTTADLAAQAGETVTLYAVWHEGEGGGNGLSVKYYDISSSGYSTWTQSEALMTNYFAAYTPTIETNTLAFGETLQSGFQSNASAASAFRQYPGLWLSVVSTNRYHGKYASKSQNNFAMLLSGEIYVKDPGEYRFATSCDDAIAIYVDGSLVCSTHNWNSPSEGTVTLSAGMHRLTMATYEDSGEQGMFVEWKKPGDSSWSPLPQSVLSGAAYAVRFDANGGEGTMAKHVYAAADDVTLPTQAFVRDGWTFVGWATEPDGPVAYADGETIEGGIDVAKGRTVTLYARWAQSHYTVHFDANGGEGTMEDETFWLGIPGWLSSNAFTRTGYDFAGWATTEGGEIAFADKALVTNLTETANGAADLYAVWSPHQYEVRFNRGTGTGSMPNRQLTYDIAANLTSNAFTRTGYTFAGWATEVGGAKVYDDGAEVLNLATNAGEVIDLYTTWTPNA